MKIKFTKDEDLQTSVSLVTGSVESDFDYIVMVKELIKTRNLEDPEYEGEFSDAERTIIESMIEKINKNVSLEEEEEQNESEESEFD